MDTKHNWPDCPKCGKPMRMMVQATIVAPAELTSQFSKTNLRRKDVYLMGVSWDGADYLCEEHGLIIGGYGNYVTKLEEKVKRIETEPSTEQLLQLIAENTGKRINLGLDDLDQYLSVARAVWKLKAK